MWECCSVGEASSTDCGGLFSTYAPYPLTVNLLQSVLLVVFVRNRVVHVANEGGVSAKEQLVWVLCKFLKGDGDDVRFSTSLFSSLCFNKSGARDETLAGCS